jgi:2,3-bisphosphoglycerate-independent phosphoglycerate mutase|tara:strand:+ start:547 stop:1749 length:1203 start_codon:yes stop_codon:yes gene_type:complete
MDLSIINQLTQTNSSKILLCVLDGLGGLPGKNGKTELEDALTPNLDKLANLSDLGLSIPIERGITPGSGPGHLALFGYDPLEYQIGRGALEAVGVEFKLTDHDLAARGNFCTVNENGNITDRRAGRISTEICQLLTKKIESSIKVDNYEVFVRPVKEHRFILIIRGKNLSDKISETDPQIIGEPTKECKPFNNDSVPTANMVNDILKQATNVIKNEKHANALTLRGWSFKPSMPIFENTWKVRAAAIAGYPMYRGLAKIVGMNVLQTGSTIDDEIKTLEENWNNYDFFFLHYKTTDTYGEDGNFEEKKLAIEYYDKLIPKINALKPDVLIITGDHSSPATMASHSWHPVPLLLSSPYTRKNIHRTFSENECRTGNLGMIYAKNLMTLAFAHAGKLTKYGA